jgi:hypothetical protein
LRAPQPGNGRAFGVDGEVLASRRKRAGGGSSKGVGQAEAGRTIGAVGSGTDDVRDALDRRVEFRARDCGRYVRADSSAPFDGFEWLEWSVSLP